MFMLIKWGPSRSLIGPVIALTFGFTGCGGPDPNVTTQHNDNFRTGAYLAETNLTPARVAKQGMQIRYWVAPADAFLPSAPPGPVVQPVKENSLEWGIFTQLLYLRQVHFQKETANGLFAGTMTAKLFALNADTGAREWVRNLMEGDTGSCRLSRGLDTTPVIDTSRQRILVLFSTQGGGSGPGCEQNLFGNSPIEYFLASLSLTDGSGFFTRIQGRDDRTGLAFNEQALNSHPALLLDHDSVFLAFGSDAALETNGAWFQGWVMRYRAGDLHLQNMMCTSPTASGAGVWQGGGGLAADPSGNVYFLTGNGTTDFRPHPLLGGGATSNHLYGDSFVKLAISGGRFLPNAFAGEFGCGPLCAGDADLGSGGAMVIPDSNRVIGGGKTGVMYLLDRNSMALVQNFEASTNEYHPDWRGQDCCKGPHLHGSPTYWRGPDSRFGNLYVWGEQDRLKLYRYDTGRQEFERTPLSSKFGMLGVYPYKVADILALPTTMPGGMISVSANGNNGGSGIVWATLPVAPCLPSLNPCWQKERPPFPFGVYAFDAESLKLLWNDATFSIDGPHWAPPTIADGKVFVPWGPGVIVVYELCQPGRQCIGSATPVRPAPNCQGCHSIPFQRSSLVYTPLTSRYPSEGAFAAYSRMALRAVAPPAEARQDLVLNGDGVQIYEAVEDAKERGKLVWRLKDATGDLQEVRFGQEPEGARAGLLRIQLREGMRWTASDGSTAVVTLEKTAAAPEKTDGAWALFRIAASGSPGVLATHKFAECVYTDGGAPAAPPKGRGETARMPYHAQYRMFR